MIIVLMIYNFLIKYLSFEFFYIWFVYVLCSVYVIFMLIFEDLEIKEILWMWIKLVYLG